ncbi:hypothetical protein, partial [Kitasatospora nipponensis]
TGTGAWYKNANGDLVCDVPVTVKVSGTIDYEIRSCPQANTTLANCEGKYGSGDALTITSTTLNGEPYSTVMQLTYTEFAKHYKVTCTEGFCSTPDSSRLLLHMLTDDIVKCWNHPGINAACGWAVATVVPGSTLIKGAKAVAAVKIAMVTGIAIDDALLALKTSGVVTKTVAMAKIEAQVADWSLFWKLYRQDKFGPNLASLPEAVRKLTTGYSPYGNLGRIEFMKKFWSETAWTDK